MKGKWQKMSIKLLLFTIATVALYALLTLVFGMTAILEEFKDMGIWMSVVFVILLDVCLLLYDRLLLPLCILYETRIKPKLHIH